MQELLKPMPSRGMCVGERTRQPIRRAPWTPYQLSYLSIEQSEYKYVVATVDPNIRKEVHKMCLPVLTYDEKRKVVLVDGYLYKRRVSEKKKEPRHEVWCIPPY